MAVTNQQKKFLRVFFLLSGFVFSTWASRIPTIKSHFDFNDAQLGTLLIAMPIGSLMGLPFSSWLISRFNSRTPLTIAIIAQAVILLGIGFAPNVWTLALCIFLLAFCIRVFNISINTQAITLQKHFEKAILGTFHGFWSTGGILGISFSTLLISLHISLGIHVCIVSTLVIVVTLSCFRFLLAEDKAATGNKLIMGKPDPFILCLGLIGFFAAICEGGMFDWSGLYFKEVLNVPVFTYGYLIFMTFMASSRFLSDKIVGKIGKFKHYTLSACCIIAGILMAVIFTNFWCALASFSLVGIGTAAVVPTTYGLAGKSTKYSPGMALSIITTYTIFGMLAGPPIIGYLSHVFTLKFAFLFFAFSGFMILPLSRWLRKHQHI